MHTLMLKTIVLPHFFLLCNIPLTYIRQQRQKILLFFKK
ncbi:hypothetical protein GTCCBUS3UF5_26950 [Geobacillus thermoleovorans CCB_US3_UF5]|uniref:Uncharacterized protein n=2 Tax=Geobacillus TaxID=129337 RepID=A0A1Q5ST73_9BACL|nr:hypothetical protein GTCCBUS3UF5_26950 [Geobacillus thermoleovorans CCB_US3_UF5]OKO91152.1 hypothetical protein BRO54_2853 [Geobacillus proteiniphilus]